MIGARCMCLFTSVLALCFAIAYGKRTSMKNMASTLQQVEEQADPVSATKTITNNTDKVDCQNSDCEWSFSHFRCQAADLESNNRCIYRYKLGDMTPSSSCRCAGAGALTAKYGTLEEAFAALSKGDGSLSLSDFTELMTKYNVPGYTAAYEFNQADKDKSGSLSKEEFIRAAEDLMEATTGGDKALGSAGTRCCCKKKLPQAENLCLNPTTLETYTLSGDKKVLKITNETIVAAYEGSTTQSHSGHTCHHSCAFHGVVSKYIGKLGQSSAHASGFQAGGKEYIRYGDALYLPSKQQTYMECTQRMCSHHYYSVAYSCGSPEYPSTCYRQECSSSNTCLTNQVVSFCGYSKLDTGLVRYDRVGTVGQCIEKDNLDSKMFVSHKVCPNGAYHRTRGKPGLQLCDCADSCP